ncbi:hypothetical protein RhiirA4_461953 [Rhizophagus irregularis]|uniref:Uncharacterized protein n=1 Tax=Rhizophagus irregularis TaxID=588596 RepID=A0A2I1GJZ4_9GLOM|nr:hypothetical protein RhiirA4_461953 [Rhizophagus irregularis]
METSMAPTTPPTVESSAAEVFANSHVTNFLWMAEVAAIYGSFLVTLKLQFIWTRKLPLMVFVAVPLLNTSIADYTIRQQILDSRLLLNVPSAPRNSFYAASRSWDNFATYFLTEFGDLDYDGSDNMLDESSEDEPDEDEDDLSINQKGLLTPPNPKDKQKARITVDKQVKNQSTTAKPDAKTSAHNSQKEKKSSKPEATQILTGYEAVGEEQERI